MIEVCLGRLPVVLPFRERDERRFASLRSSLSPISRRRELCEFKPYERLTIGDGVFVRREVVERNEEPANEPRIDEWPSSDKNASVDLSDRQVEPGGHVVRDPERCAE